MNLGVHGHVWRAAAEAGKEAATRLALGPRRAPGGLKVEGEELQHAPLPVPRVQLPGGHERLQAVCGADGALHAPRRPIGAAQLLPGAAGAAQEGDVVAHVLGAVGLAVDELKQLSAQLVQCVSGGGGAGGGGAAPQAGLLRRWGWEFLNAIW